MKMFITGVFFVLHGLVHLLYFGQSWRLFELRPKMVWPDGAWAFSRLFGDETTRLLASISCVLAAIGFVAGGTGIFAGQDRKMPSSSFQPIAYTRREQWCLAGVSPFAG